LNICLTATDAWTAVANIKLDKTARPIRILDAKWFELRTHIKEQLLDVWNSLVHCDTENNVVTIKMDSPDEPTTLERAVTGLKAYKELDNVVKSLAENLDNMILKPRTNLIARSTIPSVEITAVSLPGV
jgi:centromere/kinetochore protein ZW10